MQELGTPERTKAIRGPWPAVAGGLMAAGVLFTALPTAIASTLGISTGALSPVVTMGWTALVLSGALMAYLVYRINAD